jgi:hypothetical protein
LLRRNPKCCGDRRSQSRSFDFGLVVPDWCTAPFPTVESFKSRLAIPHLPKFAHPLSGRSGAKVRSQPSKTSRGCPTVSLARKTNSLHQFSTSPPSMVSMVSIRDPSLQSRRPNTAQSLSRLRPRLRLSLRVSAIRPEGGPGMMRVASPKGLSLSTISQRSSGASCPLSSFQQCLASGPSPGPQAPHWREQRRLRRLKGWGGRGGGGPLGSGPRAWTHPPKSPNHWANAMRLRRGVRPTTLRPSEREPPARCRAEQSRAAQRRME